MTKGYFYMLSNSTRTLLYVGATKNLLNRIQLHEQGKGASFTKKYHMKYLVYNEEFEVLKDAFKREKQVKNWKKDWKWNLVKETNPNLLDLRYNLTYGQKIQLDIETSSAC
jgi:putative endonuclease